MNNAKPNAKAVRVPASSSNLGPGFDALSLALEIYLRVEVEAGASNNGRRVVSSGVDSEKMPEGEDNLIVRVLDRVAERRNREVATGPPEGPERDSARSRSG